jgi:hypothetical protein
LNFKIGISNLQNNENRGPKLQLSQIYFYKIRGIKLFLEEFCVFFTAPSFVNISISMTNF